MKKYFVFIASAFIAFNTVAIDIPLHIFAANAATEKSLNYLENGYSSFSKSEQDWAAMALGNFGRKAAVSSTSSNSILSIARVALAKNAQGLDTRNEVSFIINGYNGSYFGSENLINDDIFAVLAIATYDKSWLDRNPQAFLEIANSQKSNGSFSHSKNSQGDTDMTSAAIWSLALSNKHSGSTSKALNYITSTQNTDGGFGYRVEAASNVASSAWATIALNTLAISSSTSENYLKNSVNSDGSWYVGGNPSTTSTAYALMAISGKSLPLKQNILTKPSVNNPKPESAPSINNPTATKQPKQETNPSQNNGVQAPKKRQVVKCIVILKASASAFAKDGTAKSEAKSSVERQCQKITP